MKKNVFKKGLSTGIVFLFVGAAVVSALNVNLVNEFQLLNRDWLYVGGSGEGNYTTIQSAINAADNGDTIFVYDDSSPYYEYITINKSIDLIGENKYTTVINNNFAYNNVVNIVINWVNISNFTVQNGSDGIYIDHSSNINISNNIITNNNANGIHLNYAPDCYIHENIVSNNGNRGLYIENYSNYNNIIDNIITNSATDGINFAHISYGNICNNTLSNNERNGISNYDSSYNNFTNNIIINNSVYGIYLEQVSNYNNFIGNYIINNRYGIGISISFRSLFNNIYNNFLDNINNTYNINSYNHWNVTKTLGTNIIGGPYLGGNYWSDYIGTDDDGDGIGEIPYNISGMENKDYCPLVDITPPEITDIIINPSAQNVSGYVNISCNVIDKVAVDEVWINITYPDSTTHNFSMNPSYYLNQTYSQIGTYQFFIWANDTSNNINMSNKYTFEIINHPPNAPDIDGPNHGKPGIEYTYCINISDPDDDSLFVLWDWNDGTTPVWMGPYESGSEICDSHTWNKKRIYNISVTVKDVYGATVTVYKKVTIPRDRAIDNPILRFFGNYPIFFKMFQLLIQR